MVLIKLVLNLIFKHSLHKFTFQYGSNQIKICKKYLAKLVKFTFQYGSNQMFGVHGFGCLKVNLHSNMVLIKLYSASSLVCLDIKFTFQYGSNQIRKSYSRGIR